MSEIGAYEAKTHLPRLLNRVEDGERFTITRHGKPVAEIGPAPTRDKEEIRRKLAEIRAFRNELAQRGVSWKDILEPGETLRELAHRSHRY
jgi:prevent-host-death family protein